LIEYSFAECREQIELGEGFARGNVIAIDGKLKDLPKLKVIRQGVPGTDLSGCRLQFGAGARGNYIIYIGAEPLRLDVGAETRCVINMRAWRKPVVEIGARTTINGCKLVADDATVVFGPDCMLSDDITVQGGDQHGLIDLATLQVTNAARSRIEIGEHVWLGRGSTIMRDVTIGAGSVVGAGAIVTASAGPCRYLVGVPARAVREGASWTRSPAGASPAEMEFFARMRQDRSAEA
jgi:acetyltransferase-like isoleucine patch superfamily enzyme